jgi:hypothetical protein
LEKRVRQAARDILQRAIEAEAEQLLAEVAAVSLFHGHLGVVRYAHLPAREILTSLGQVEVPKARDRSGARASAYELRSRVP